MQAVSPPDLWGEATAAGGAVRCSILAVGRVILNER